MDSDKKPNLWIKYYELNMPEIKKQVNRFKTLFPRGKELYIFLFIRTMNMYSVLIRHNFLGFLQKPEFQEKVIESILDRSFINDVLLYFPMNNQQSDEQALVNPFIENENENDIKYIIENKFRFPDSTNDSLNYDEYSHKLMRFFDYHFQRINGNVFFNSYAGFNTEFKFVDNTFNEYLNYIASINKEGIELYSGCPCYRIPLDNNFIEFFASIFSHPLTLKYLSDMNIIPLNWSDRKHNWSDQKKAILKNYFINFNLAIVFQNKKYQNCLIRFGGDYYKWNCSENNKSGLDKLSSSQLYLIMTHGPQGINWFNRLYNTVDAEYCLSVAFPFPKPKSKKPNKELIKNYLKYFTMNNTTVLDNLALDFVNSILNQNYSHKNTVVIGDYDKFYKWINLFSNNAILQTELIEIFPYITPFQIHDLRDHNDDKIQKILKDNSREINVIRCTHWYYLINSNSDLIDKPMNYVNIIDFPYGGEFYNYAPLSDVDRLEIAKLLLIHGWHLLNSDKPAATITDKNECEKDFWDHLINTDETRIPIKVLHQIYSYFTNNQKTITDLQKEFQEKGFKYTTMAVRNSDREYFESLSNQAANHFLNLDIPTANRQRMVSCQISPEFWDTVSLAHKKENESKESEEFNKYLKELSKKYAEFFVEITPPEPEKDDPYAGFIEFKKYPDEKLQ